MKRFDCHVHLDEIVGNGLSWNSVDLDEHVKHIKKDKLVGMYAIYEDVDKLLELRTMAPECDIQGMFWPKDDYSVMDDLYSLGALQAIKCHPVVDCYELNSKNIENQLHYARKYSIPILYHADDRKETSHLTSPKLQERLAKENSDVKLIIGHGGAYANPRLVGERNNAAIGYWKRCTSLIENALELSFNYDNVFYDTTVCNNKIKADMINNFLEKHPSFKEKIMIGTDFPIRKARWESQLKMLRNL